MVIKLKKEDNEIIDMLFLRDEQALSCVEEKYGALCRKLAYGIIGDYDYSAECVNTSFYKLWQSVPPARPQSLKAYLCKIVRSVAFSMRKKNSLTQTYLTELSELLPDDNGVDDKEHPSDRGGREFLLNDNGDNITAARRAAQLKDDGKCRTEAKRRCDGCKNFRSVVENDFGYV